MWLLSEVEVAFHISSQELNSSAVKSLIAAVWDESEPKVESCGNAFLAHKLFGLEDRCRQCE